MVVSVLRSWRRYHACLAQQYTCLDTGRRKAKQQKKAVRKKHFEWNFKRLRFFLLTIVFSNLFWFKVTRLGTSTSLPKGHSSWNSIITQDDVAGIATMQWQAPPNWVVWMRRMRMRPDSWDVGMAIDKWCKHLRALARSGYQNLKPTVRSTNMHEKKDV